jgi:class 3 adenylate cyclase
VRVYRHSRANPNLYTTHVGAVQSMIPAKTLPYVERGLNFCERFETVTILFSDIISFTKMAASMDPLEVVNMLNELYRMYDGLVDRHNVYKVETIGDAFMCAGGTLPHCSPPRRCG